MMIALTRRKTKNYLTTGIGPVSSDTFLLLSFISTYVLFQVFHVSCWKIVYLGAGERKVDLAVAFADIVFTNKCKFSNVFCDMPLDA